MNTAEELHKAIILDHYQRPRHAAPLANPSVVQKASNPSCGDELTMQVQVQNGCLVAVACQARGCAISVASASVLAQLVQGKTLQEAKSILADLHNMLRGGVVAESLGDAVAFVGVAKLHARVKCASLSWQALEQVLEQIFDRAQRDG